jgi:hypothetical protein
MTAKDRVQDKDRVILYTKRLESKIRKEGQLRLEGKTRTE